jgi:hypothetical protein
MDGVERLQQMNDIERMREIMDVISNNMREQNDKDRLEILAMLASTTAMEANLMSVNFARRANAVTTQTKTKKSELLPPEGGSFENRLKPTKACHHQQKHERG